MKNLILKPEQIIVPGEYEVGNEAILKVYFKVFNEGRGNGIPPVIVMSKYWTQSDSLKNYTDNQRARETYDSIRDSKADYFLIDGNHRGIASTLCHLPLKSLVVENENDLSEIEKMVSNGSLLSFPHSENSLIDISKRFVECVFNSGDGNAVTLKERVDLLTAKGELPSYMIERYKSNLREQEPDFPSIVKPNFPTLVKMRKREFPKFDK